MKRAEFCRLTAFSSTAIEAPEMVEAIKAAGITVIKSLFLKKKPVSLMPPVRGFGFPVGKRGRALPGGARAGLEMGRGREFVG